MPGQAHHENIIAGLDIGTSKIGVTAGKIVGGKLEVIGISISSSTGIRKGMVINIDSVLRSLEEAVKEAESSIGVEINKVYVSITG
ncbi:MAG: cell division protein FtsA, partial [Nitrospirota bacterium]